MDTFIRICYNRGHETSRKSPTVRDAKTSGHFDASGGQELPPGGESRKGFPKLRGTLASSVPAGRVEGTSVAADPWTPPAALPRTAQETATVLGERTSSRRLWDRPVDVETYRRPDPKAFWGSVFAFRGMAAAGRGVGVELSEARTSGAGTRRGSHRPVEAEDMAAYKKKPKSWGLTLRFLTKVGFCSFPMFERPGHREVAHRSCAIATGATGSLRSRLSAFLRRINIWAFISAFTSPTLPGSKSSNFCATSSGISDGRWFCFGTEDVLTSAKRSKSFCVNGRVCMSILSRFMLPNSTRQSLFGQSPNTTYRMARRKIFSNSTDNFVIAWKGFGTHKSFSGRAFMLRICHGQDNSIVSIIY